MPFLLVGGYSAILYPDIIENRQILYTNRLRDRDIRQFIDEDRPNKAVLLVEGARQVGKTRLVHHALADRPEALCFDLERDALVRSRIDACQEFSEFDELLRDEYEFDGDDGGLLFIDEAQESLQLGRFVRSMKEEWSRATVILSGSTMTRLFRGTTRYPVGRVRRMVVRPFSFSEFLLTFERTQLADVVCRGDLRDLSAARHQRLLDWYDRYLHIGGLPDVVAAAAAGEDHGVHLARIAADYEQDFIRILGEDDLPLVQASLRAVANFVGSPFKNTTVLPAPSTRTNERINQVLGRLESWHMVLRSDQMGPSSSGSHRYLPKRYLFDTGLLRHLRETAVPRIDLSEGRSDLRSLLGGVIENQVAVDLVRHDHGLVGWKRSSAGQEIDFVVRLAPSGIVPLECKAGLRPDRRQLRGLRAYLDDHPVHTAVLVSLAPAGSVDYADGKKSVWLPAYGTEQLARHLEAT